MRAIIVLKLSSLVLFSSASGLGKGKTQNGDSSRLRTFAALLLSQQQSPYHILNHHTDRRYPNHLSRFVAVRLDADRCYYGELDAEGNVIKGPKPRLARGSPLMPSPTNTPVEVVDAQFLAFSRDYDSRSIGDAFEHVAPKIVAQHELDADKFKSILSGPKMEGIIGCDSWEVLAVETLSTNRAIVSLRVLPKPIPGCVKTSGVAGQGGITWPTYWKWDLGKVTEGPLAGCWMLEQMIPQKPLSVTTIDTSAQKKRARFRSSYLSQRAEAFAEETQRRPACRIAFAT